MAKHFIYLFSLVLFTFFSCRKDIGKLPVPVTNEVTETPDYDTADFTCREFPTGPFQKDTIKDFNTVITHWTYNPANPTEVLYLHKFFDYWTYNFVTKERRYLFSNSLSWPQVNRRGWIVYHDLNLGICKIKFNGDSLTQLTFDQGQNPQWDYTDTAIYYYRADLNKAYKINWFGKRLDSIAGEVGGGIFFSGYSKISNKMVYQKFTNNNPSIYIKNLSTGTETFVMATGGDNITFDNADENIYWQASLGIVKCNVLTHKLDTILKNICPNHFFVGSIISPSTNKMAITWESYVGLPKNRVMHEYRTYEINLDDPAHKLKEVKFAPK